AHLPRGSQPRAPEQLEVRVAADGPDGHSLGQTGGRLVAVSVAVLMTIARADPDDAGFDGRTVETFESGSERRAGIGRNDHQHERARETGDLQRQQLGEGHRRRGRETGESGAQTLAVPGAFAALDLDRTMAGDLALCLSCGQRAVEVVEAAEGSARPVLGI